MQPNRKTRNWIGNLIVIIITLFIFWICNIKSLLDLHKAIEEPIRGKVIGYTYDEKQSSYLYFTDRGDTLNSSYYLKNNPNFNLKIGDYIGKQPYTLDLQIFRLDTNNLLKVEPREIGSFN